MTAFDRALRITLGIEGGDADVAGDRGGRTSRGMTQHLYDAYRASKNLPPQDVSMMTAEEERAIAREEFWDPCRCDELPEDLAVEVFDMAFNSSPAAAKKTLQRALGVAVDGVIGEETLAAARAGGIGLEKAFLKERAEFFIDICRRDVSQIKFLHGWMNRLIDQSFEVAAA